MKRLSIICTLAFTLLASPCLAMQYCKDFLEPGNSGGWTGSLKTFEDEWTLSPSQTVAVDIWINDVSESLLTGGFWISFDPAKVSVVTVEVYNDSALPGPWGSDFTTIIPDSGGPGTYLVVCGDLDCVSPDAGGDIILARVTFQCQSLGDAGITIEPIPVPGFDSVVGCSIPTIVYDEDINPNTVTIHQINDSDGDGIDSVDDNCPFIPNPGQEDGDVDGAGNVCDNCPQHPNGSLLRLCVSDDMFTYTDTTCTGNLMCAPDVCGINQKDSFPPQGNGIGDACDCEGDFDCDGDVDGTDAGKFKTDFGRTQYLNPCTGTNPCAGDFICDGDVDGTDAALFKSDFARNPSVNPCPACLAGEWCSY